MSLSQLATLQVKITYLGPQNDVIASLGFTSSSNVYNVGTFFPYYRPGFDYTNDTVSLKSFSASTSELKAVIDSVGQVSQVTAGQADTINGILSFSLFNSAGGDKAFEAIVDDTVAFLLFEKLRQALSANKPGLRKLSEMACPLDLLEAAVPSDVSSNATVKISGIRLNRHTGYFVGQASVKNTSGGTLAAPLSLVFDLQGNLKLINADGTTCGTSPVGREFMDLPLSGAGLAPGDSIVVDLQFDNPDLELIQVTTKVLAGPGAR